MKIETWHEGMSLEDTKNLAYWERNVLALLLANLENETCLVNDMDITCGWYYDTDNNWDGWKRVLSLFDGNVTFHVPDDFDLGDLPEIEPNWNGHTTFEKYSNILEFCGVPVDA